MTALCYHPRMHSVFLSGGAANGIACWDIQSNSVINQYSAPFGQVQSLEFINNGMQFVSSADVVKKNSTDKGIVVWDFETVNIPSSTFNSLCL